MTNDKKIVKSFRINDSLSPTIWEEEDGTFKLNPEIREALLKIVDDYPPCVQIEPASICNFKCVFCYQADLTFNNKNKRRFLTGVA